MQELILKRLEIDRKALLDLSLRNPLLSYRLSKARGVQVVNEQSHIVYDLLVTGGKKLQFADNGKGEDEDASELFQLSEGELQRGYTDNKLQTAETAKSLQKRLLKTYYDANASIQEQGVNILYLALGTLNWYEDDNSEDARQAPLVLVPVELERQNSNEKFKLSYTKADVESNLSLQEKLKADFGIKIPLLADADYPVIEDYYTAVEKEIKGKNRWAVVRNAIYLGFFSFGKFMLFQDLDNAKWPEGAKPVNHPLLQALLQTGFSDPEPSIGDDVFLDSAVAVANLLQVLEADSTQVQAMLAVDEGRNMIIQGPPGTGKSQTITNLIANAIGKGKKVLFVAEKLAALEVVKRRLDAVHLGDACLELHSHKANKKDVLKELSRTLDLGKPTMGNLEGEVRQTEVYKTELNDYCKAVNEFIGQSGMSPFGIMGALYKQRLEAAHAGLKTLNLPGNEHCDGHWLRRATDIADKIEQRLLSIGLPSALPFWGSALKVVLPTELGNIEMLLKGAIASHESLNGLIESLSAKCGISKPKDAAGLARWLILFEMASKAPRLDDAQVESAEWLAHETRIRETIQKGKTASALHAQYSGPFMPEDAWTADYAPLLLEIKTNGRKWWKFLIGSYRAAVKTIAGWSKGVPLTNYVQRLKLLEDLIAYRALTAQLSAADGDMQRCFPKSWRGKDSDWGALEERAEFMVSVHRAITAGQASRDILNILLRISPEEARMAYDDLERTSGQYKSATGTLLQRVQYKTPHLLHEGKAFGEWNYHEQLALLESWQGQSESLQLVAGWNTLKDVATEAACAFLVAESEVWPDAATSLSASLQKTWLEYYLHKAFTERRPLQQFDQSTHTAVLEKFRKGDILVQQYHRAKAALEHFNKLPPKGGSGQVATLAQEFNKKARHKPIRKLIEEAGTAIQAIKPVFMMSPLSVANYLAPGTINFDLVIFDEASQVKPVDAFGAILRGKQLVVVGDTKQLPPTSFFDKMVMDEATDEDDESYSATSDMPSILSLCNAQRAPERMLRWHYRSRHESLISVSNYEFYESRLVVFPSPGDIENLGLVLHYLPHTAYDRGKSRTNKQEADAVAEAVMSHAAHYQDKSLGVVAFSEAQKGAVMDAIELRRKANPGLEPFFSTTGAEPFFVKNLESVQGDERDVIMISVGYGKDASGYAAMSFGPLNSDGGEKRLNVLITRAKERCEVFTNLTHDDIDLSRAKGIGVKAFKTFLKYAGTGILDVPKASGKEADSPFEEAVCKQLEGLEYTVHKQVGSNGFFIDLAVEDADKPGKYILGIECDGAAYHSARSARDRDRLRQAALEGMGWTFHRIWSTDWFRHPDRELKKLVEAIEKSKLRIPAPKLPEKAAEVVMLERKVSDIKTTIIPKYTVAKLPASVSVGNDEFHLHPPQRIAGWLEAVVRIESPVHIDEASRRLVEAAGLSKVGSRIKAAIQQAAVVAAQSGSIRKKGDFLWNVAMQTPVVRDRNELPAASRKMQLIAPEEIGEALVKAATNAFAVSEDALIADCGRIFGFARVTEDMKEAISKVLEQTLAEGRLIQEGAWIKPRTH